MIVENKMWDVSKVNIDGKSSSKDRYMSYSNLSDIVNKQEVHKILKCQLKQGNQIVSLIYFPANPSKMINFIDWHI